MLLSSFPTALIQCRRCRSLFLSCSAVSLCHQFSASLHLHLYIYMHIHIFILLLFMHFYLFWSLIKWFPWFMNENITFACVPLQTPISISIYQSSYSFTEKTNQTILMEMCSHVSAVGQDQREKSYYTCLSFSVFFTLLWRQEGKAPISTSEKKNPNKTTKIPKHHCIKK